MNIVRIVNVDTTYLENCIETMKIFFNIYDFMNVQNTLHPYTNWKTYPNNIYLISVIFLKLERLRQFVKPNIQIV